MKIIKHLTLVILSFVCIMTIVGCGGGSNSKPDPPTPTSEIKVIADKTSFVYNDKTTLMRVFSTNNSNFHAVFDFSTRTKTATPTEPAYIQNAKTGELGFANLEETSTGSGIYNIKNTWVAFPASFTIGYYKTYSDVTYNGIDFDSLSVSITGTKNFTVSGHTILTYKTEYNWTLGDNTITQITYFAPSLGWYVVDREGSTLK